MARQWGVGPDPRFDKNGKLKKGAQRRARKPEKDSKKKGGEK